MDTTSVAEGQAIAATAGFEKASPGQQFSENFNCADFVDEEEMQDVVESFEVLHRSIPWLQRADVSSESHCGQLKILQAAIDYIIDLEEQLADQLSGDLYLAALQSGRVAIQRSLAASSSLGAARRPFADVNEGPSASSPSSLLSPMIPPTLQLLPQAMSPVSLQLPDFALTQRTLASALDDPATGERGGRQC